MPDLYLNVPYVSQLNIGNHVPGYAGHSETTGCWYASTCMLGYFREQGPRLGVPERYQTASSTGVPNPLPINPDTLKVLVDNEGLTQVPLPVAKAWTIDGLHSLLRDCGPILIGRGFNSGGTLTGGHIVVVVGVLGSHNLVVVHDPAVGPDKTLTLDQFNGVFPWDRPEAPWLALVKLPPLSGNQIRGRANATVAAPTVRQRSGAFLSTHRKP